jgi:dTDP-4-amino-4,6-dideoxygalactose transaminase
MTNERRAEDAAVMPRVPFAYAEVCEEAREAAARVLASGWLTTGPEVASFEEEFAREVGAGDAVAVSSCTAAIELSLRALGLPPGAKVLTSTMTFCGAVHAIVHAGLRPVLVDVDPLTLMPDVDTTARAAAQAGGVDAMVVLHFGGFPAQVEALAEAAGIGLHRVVEDAAHALGAWVGDRPVGALSAATCFSFYATKNLPIGEGGMVTTDDQALADYVRRARLHGMSLDAWKRYLPGASWRYDVDVAGLKANMTDLQAAIGRAQLRRFPAWQERRAALSEQYDRLLSDVPGIRLPARPHEGVHAWHLYVVQVEPEAGRTRDDVIERLGQAGVGSSVHFIPIHHQTYFRNLLGVGPGDLPAADLASTRILSLPLNPTLSDAQVEFVCRVIEEACASPRALPVLALGEGR